MIGEFNYNTKWTMDCQVDSKTGSEADFNVSNGLRPLVFEERSEQQNKKRSCPGNAEWVISEIRTTR